LVFCCGEKTNQQARARASGVIAESVQYNWLSFLLMQYKRSRVVARAT
jgi:hypothetical protein